MSRDRLFLFLLAIVFASILLSPGARDLIVGDETKYAQVIRELRTTNSWFLPTLEGTPFTHKPPLHFWMIGALTFVFGVYSTWSFVIPSLIAFAFLIWLMWRMNGPLAAFVCATSLLVWGSAQTARMDVSFTAFITLGIWMLQRESLIAAAIALGIATMIKGPMAIVIAIVLFALEWWRRREAWGSGASPARIVAAITILIAIPLLWFIPAMIAGGSAYTHDVLQKQLAGRAVGSWVHASPPWYYLLHAPAFLLPWFILAVTAIVMRWREQRFNINWILAVLLPYSLMSSKLDVYMMALIPPLSIVIADCITNAARATTRANVAMLLLLLAIGIAGFFVHIPPVPRGIAVNAILAILIAASALGLLLATRGAVASTIAVGLVPVVVLAYITVTMMPAINELASTRPLIRALIAQHVPPEQIALYSCPYLWSRDMPHDLERVRYVTPESLASTNARVVATSRRHANEIDLRGFKRAGELQMIGKPFDVYRR